MKNSPAPKISVIMSIYNGVPFLKEAIKSILKQTYKNFEFIIVDDASTDNTLKYLESQKDKRITLIKNTKNLGLASSLNKALKAAKGKYIARMDADDISLPKRFEEQLKFLSKNPQTDLCGTWVKLINSSGKVIGQVHKPIKDHEIKKMNRWFPAVIHPTWLYKKKVADKLQGYSEQFDMAEDYDFLLRAKDFKMANVDKELLLWRRVAKRRSREDIEKMYRQSLVIRWKHLIKGDLGIFFAPLILRSLITTYLFPTKLKILLNQKAGLG